MPKRDDLRISDQHLLESQRGSYVGYGTKYPGFAVLPDTRRNPPHWCNLQWPLVLLPEEWVQLFDRNNRHVLLFIGSALFKEIVINLTRTEHNAFYLRRIQRINFPNRRLESTVGKILHTGDTRWMTQKRFRRHHH